MLFDWTKSCLKRNKKGIKKVVTQNFAIARGRFRRVIKFLQESISIAFDFIWKVMLSGINFATLLDPPLIAVYFHGKNIKMLI